LNNQRTVLLFAKSIDGGTGSFVEGLQNLKSLGFEVETIVLEKPSGRKKISYTYIKAHPAKFYPSRYRFSLRHSQTFLKEIKWYRSKIEMYKPDVVVSMDVHCNLIATIARYFLRIQTKLILTTHINLKNTIDDKSSHLLRFLIHLGISQFYKKADLNVYSSERMRNSFKELYGISLNSKVIAYGVVPFSNQKSTHHGSIIKIMSIGRLVEQKDFFTLINAFDEVFRKFPNVSLDIIGDGPLKKRLAKFIHTKKSSHRITLLGWKQNTPNWIEKADIFVLTSKREGFPYVLLEALSVGRPIISTDAPFGPAEILSNGKYGILVAVGNVRELAKQISSLVSSSRERLKYQKKAKERAGFFSQEKMLKAYASAISQVLNQQ